MLSEMCNLVIFGTIKPIEKYCSKNTFSIYNRTKAAFSLGKSRFSPIVFKLFFLRGRNPASAFFSAAGAICPASFACCSEAVTVPLRVHQSLLSHAAAGIALLRKGRNWHKPRGGLRSGRTNDWGWNRGRDNRNRSRTGTAPFRHRPRRCRWWRIHRSAGRRR